MLKRSIICTFPALLLFLAPGRIRPAEEDPAPIRAVLFASPSCSHCAKVIEETLPMLADRYGPRLQVAIVSTGTPNGHELFLSACMRYGLLRMAVPMLVVGDTALVGSLDIPEKFPDLIEKHIAAGGIDWPPIPGFKKLLAASSELPSGAPPHAAPPQTETATAAPPQSAENAGPDEEPRVKPPAAPVAKSSMGAPSEPPASKTETKTETPRRAALPGSSSASSPRSSMESAASQTAFPASPPASIETSSASAATSPPAVKTEPSGIVDLTGGHAKTGVLDRILIDPYGNGLAILVLIGMLLTLLMSLLALRKPIPPVDGVPSPRRDWMIPALTLLGLVVAAYLSHVEVRELEAVCGPVGDCNTVQQSEFARLFGVLPIGILGMLGFIAILSAWTLRRWGKDRIPLWAAVCILAMTAFGTLFSVYLTFLEPFVIGATCLWCLSSAVIMTALYALAFNPGRQAWSALGLWRRFSGKRPSSSGAR